ncbi:MAG: hypothetical protein QM785_13525 [Pyrinomonadaceae bacterium]
MITLKFYSPNDGVAPMELEYCPGVTVLQTFRSSGATQPGSQKSQRGEMFVGKD